MSCLATQTVHTVQGLANINDLIVRLTASSFAIHLVMHVGMQPQSYLGRESQPLTIGSTADRAVCCKLTQQQRQRRVNLFTSFHHSHYPHFSLRYDSHAVTDEQRTDTPRHPDTTHPTPPDSYATLANTRSHHPWLQYECLGCV